MWKCGALRTDIGATPYGSYLNPLPGYVKYNNALFTHRITIEALTRIKPLNMWRYRRAAARAELEALTKDPLVQSYRATIAHEAEAMGNLRDDEREALTPPSPNPHGL